MLPEIAPRRALTDLLFEQLRIAGFNWHGATVPPAPRFWQRPPLFTAAMIGDAPLQPHVAIRVDRDLEELAEVYERFVGGFIIKRTFHSAPPVKWLGAQLGLSGYAAKHLFTPPVPGALLHSLHLNLVQYAALVAYNNHHRSVEDPQSYEVTAGRFRFGIANGALASNMLRRPVVVVGLRHRAGLTQLARGSPYKPANASLFDAARAWVCDTSGITGELLEGLLVGLDTSWWRQSGHFPQRLKGLTYRDCGPEALHLACRHAREFRQFEMPVMGLYKIFVPQFLHATEFQAAFGNPKQIVKFPISEQFGNRLEAEIAKLDPGP